MSSIFCYFLNKDVLIQILIFFLFLYSKNNIKKEWNEKKMKWIKNKLKFGSRQHKLKVLRVNQGEIINLRVNFSSFIEKLISLGT